jgi:hypothetical protein
MVTASADQNPDLFWAVRGGGGNFGVITDFRLKLSSGQHCHCRANRLADRACRRCHALLPRFYPSQAPEDLNGIFAIYTAPPGPPFPEHLHLKKVCGVTWCYTGPPELAEQVLLPIKNFTPPVLMGLKPMLFPFCKKRPTHSTHPVCSGTGAPIL